MIRGLLIVGFVLGCGVLGEEPAIVNYAQNRFEYEHNVLEKLVYLEQFKNDATERIAALEKQLHSVLGKLLDLEQFKEDASETISVLEKQLQGPSTRSPLTNATYPPLTHATPSPLTNSTQYPLTQRSSTTYVHWGMQTCPNVTATTMVYSGQAAGGNYLHAGSGEYICLPNDPEYDKYNNVSDDHRSLMYGAEYETHQNPPALGELFENDVPCSVCLARGKTTVMIPGRTTCYNGWIKEYQGYLMGERHNNHGKGYVCMDKNAEALHASYADLNGALFYPVEGRCGSLKCPPYVEGAELACVVCSNTT